MISISSTVVSNHSVPGAWRFDSNNDFKNTRSSLRYIRETEYQKFISLKRDKHLGLSDYASIWKVIIYLLISQQVNGVRGFGGARRQ